MQSNGIYTCKILTYDANTLPTEYHNSDLYDKMCYAKIVKLKLVFDNDNIIVKSVYGNDGTIDCSQFIDHVYTKDTLSKAYVRSLNELNYYVLPCSIYKLDTPNVFNCVVPLLLKVSDLKQLGETVFRGKYGTNYIFNINEFHIDKIFLRSILAHLNYNILSEEDFQYDGSDVPHIIVETDMPFEIYQEISGLGKVERDEQFAFKLSSSIVNTDTIFKQTFSSNKINDLTESAGTSPDKQNNSSTESINTPSDEKMIEQSPIECDFNEQINNFDDCEDHDDDDHTIQLSEEQTLTNFGQTDQNALMSENTITSQNEFEPLCGLSEEEILKHLENENLIY